MEYLDFELEIQSGIGREYPLAVLHSPAGEARAIMRFPFDDLALENSLLKLQNALLRSGGQRRQALSDEQRAVRDFGQVLFDALLTGEVRSRYDVSCREARTQGKGLRLKLRIQPPNLAALPWEFLHDSRQAEYICLSRSTPLVRYLELPQPIQPLAMAPPLRILGMVASPGDLSQLDLGCEKQRVEEATRDLAARGLVSLTWLEGQTWRDLQRAMRVGPWHIFHFVGHGTFDPQADEGLIALLGEKGRAHLLHATELARLLADHDPLRLVVLNACEGARGGETDIFSSTASILVRRGIPAVLAMQYQITDQAAIELARAFYEALVDGLPVDGAVGEARKAISLAVANTLEWGTPVLYMRTPDGTLFDLSPAPPHGEASVGSREMARDREPEQAATSTQAKPALAGPPPAATAGGGLAEAAPSSRPQAGVPLVSKAAESEVAVPTPKETSAVPDTAQPAAISPYIAREPKRRPRWLWSVLGGSAVLLVIAGLFLADALMGGIRSTPRPVGTVPRAPTAMAPPAAVPPPRTPAPTAMPAQVPADVPALPPSALPVTSTPSDPLRMRVAFYGSDAAGLQGGFAIMDQGGIDAISMMDALPGTPLELSHDGGLIAYASCRSDPGIHVSRLDGTQAKPLHYVGGCSVNALRWSPDDRKLSYVNSVDGRLHIVQVDNGVDTSVPVGDLIDFHSWSPSGDRIVYGQGRGGERRLYITDLNGDTQPLTDPKDVGGCESWAPDWSPDGSAIAFTACDRLYTIAPDGIGLKQVLPDSPVYAPRWSVDGQWILYIAASTLMRVRPNGKDLSAIGTLRVSGGPFSLGPLK